MCDTRLLTRPSGDARTLVAAKSPTGRLTLWHRIDTADDHADGVRFLRHAFGIELRNATGAQYHHDVVAALDAGNVALVLLCCERVDEAARRAAAAPADGVAVHTVVFVDPAQTMTVVSELTAAPPLKLSKAARARLRVAPPDDPRALDGLDEAPGVPLRIDQFDMAIPIEHPSVRRMVEAAAATDPLFAGLEARYDARVGIVLHERDAAPARVERALEIHLGHEDAGTAAALALSDVALTATDGAPLRLELVQPLWPAFRILTATSPDAYVYGFDARDVDATRHLVLGGVPTASLLVRKRMWRKHADRGFVFATRDGLATGVGQIALPLHPKPTPPSDRTDAITLGRGGYVQHLLTIAQMGATDPSEFPTLGDGTGFRVRNGVLENESAETPGLWKPVWWTA